jgi:hypothetical protein
VESFFLAIFPKPSRRVESSTAGARLWTIADCFINPQHKTN